MNEDVDADEKVIFIYNSIKYFIPYFSQKGILTYPLLKEMPFTLGLIRKVSSIIGLPKSIWYAGWKNKLNSVTTIIIFANSSRTNKPAEIVDLLRYIKSVNPIIRIIYWYWNPVAKYIDPISIPGDLCKKWSFDKVDSEFYDICYNSQFYLDNIKLPQNSIVYDVVFLGIDKGRKAFINNIKDKMIEAGVKPYFYIADDAANNRNYKGPAPFIAYSEYLELVSKSKAIFDFIQDGQTGLTLRPLESIFFQKKLITNDISIKLSDFYNPNNIFIIGVDEIGLLKHFLSIPYEPVASDILKYYDVSNWLKRFVE